MAILLSLIFHAVVLFGITFKLPPPRIDKAATPLEVVLVNSKSVSKPHKANILAQANLDGGGNTSVGDTVSYEDQTTAAVIATLQDGASSYVGSTSIGSDTVKSHCSRVSRRGSTSTLASRSGAKVKCL